MEAGTLPAQDPVEVGIELEVEAPLVDATAAGPAAYVAEALSDVGQAVADALVPQKATHAARITVGTDKILDRGGDVGGRPG